MKTETTKDYNGVIIPKEIEEDEIIITINQKYKGKYNTDEIHQVDEFTLYEIPPCIETHLKNMGYKITD